MVQRSRSKLVMWHQQNYSYSKGKTENNKKSCFLGGKPPVSIPFIVLVVETKLAN